MTLMRPVTKWSSQLRDPAAMPWLMRRAFHVARNGRPGSVFVEVPGDLGLRRGGDRGLPQRRPAAAARATVERRRRGPRRAARGVAAAGRSSPGRARGRPTPAPRCAPWRRRVGAGVLTTPGGRGSFPEEHALALGPDGPLLHERRAAPRGTTRTSCCRVGSRLEELQAGPGASLFPAGRALRADRRRPVRHRAQRRAGRRPGRRRGAGAGGRAGGAAGAGRGRLGPRGVARRARRAARRETAADVERARADRPRARVRRPAGGRDRARLRAAHDPRARERRARPVVVLLALLPRPGGRHLDPARRADGDGHRASSARSGRSSRGPTCTSSARRATGRCRWCSASSARPCSTARRSPGSCSRTAASAWPQFIGLETGHRRSGDGLRAAHRLRGGGAGAGRARRGA